MLPLEDIQLVYDIKTNIIKYYSISQEILWNEARQLWSDVENWLTQLGFADGIITDTNILVGDSEKN